MAEGQGPTRDAAQGTLSRLLVEIFQAPEVDLASSWREPLKPGDVVGRYQVRAEIGRGGFGAVYEAFDPELGRSVALKALRSGRNKHQLSQEWIKKEAEAVAKLDHPAIVTIFDVGTCPAGAYLVMELLRGETLSARIGKGPLPADEALRIAEQMAEGLAHAHLRGVLHRDLKPANVFVCDDGRVKLLDFGLAHLLGTEGSSGAGTPAYMAPEQAARRAVDERADVWAAGVVLGEMLTGKRPVERTPAIGAEEEEAKTELLWEAPKEASPASVGTPKVGGVPRPVAKVMAAALSEDPAARPTDGMAWLVELRSARERVERPRRLRRIAVFASAFILVGLAVAGIATWRLWERQMPGGRVTVAVADFVNETGEKELDGLSGLLITSLEQSAALRVLTRSRMFDVLKQLGKENVERIDETLAREVGRHSRVRALLLASVRKAGDAYLVEMRALDPLLDEYVFTVKDRAANQREVMDLVDRLGATTRMKLGAPKEVKPLPVVAAITTASMRAWDLLFQSRRAHDLARFEDAFTLAEAALAEDPESPLATYQVYVATKWRPRQPGWDKKAAMEKSRAAVSAMADRLPEKEQLLFKLESAFDSRRPEEIDPLCEKMSAAYPLDKDVLLDCGTIRFLYYFADRDRTVAYIERALQLDPSYAIADYRLGSVLASLGGAEEKLDLLRQRAAVATEHLPMRELAVAFLTARAEPDAVALLERMRAKLGMPFPPPILADYRSHTGRPAEAEPLVRGCLAGIDDVPEARRDEMRNWCTRILFESLVAQGKRMEALETLQGWRLVDPLHAALFRMRVHVAVGATDSVRAVREELDGLGVGDDPDVSANAADTLLLGGLPHEAAPFYAQARRSVMWEHLQHDDRMWGEVMGFVAEGAPDAEARLRALLDHQPHLGTQYDTNLMLARVLRERGACPDVVAVLERARRIPPSVYVGRRPLSQPLALHWLAECYEKLGDVLRARERNDEHLHLWANADPDLPLLTDAKALQARLGAVSSAR